MKIFCTDLDNTMIYSYKHDIGPDRVNVEVYQGREISFVTKKTYHLLQQVRQRVLFVPVTTRTLEQYNRIDLGIGTPSYALVCNGGILLADGKEVEEWYQESLRLIVGAKGELAQAYEWLERDSRRNFELRFIRELFLFTKCEEPERVVSDLRKRLKPEQVEVFHNGSKVYVLPKRLGKGEGVRRLKEFIGGGEVIAAGDSEFDISMLNVADIAIAPEGLRQEEKLSGSTVFMPGRELFSDELLRYVAEECLGG